MYDVVLLTLRDGDPGCGDGGACCAAGADPGTGQTGAPAGGGSGGPGVTTGPDRDRRGCAGSSRVPVLACAEALRAAGARVETVEAGSDAEIDAVLARLDGPPRPDGLVWPDTDGKTRLVIAVAADGQLRAVLRRMVRRYAPPPSRRTTDLPASRTVPDLPPVGVLPLDPARGPVPRDLAALLGLPREPRAVAGAVLGGHARRLDLLRHDGGSVTLDGALLGGADDAGRAVPWRGRVEVDDAVLTNGDEPVLACVVGNAGGYAELDGLPLLTTADPTDGRIDVALALPVTHRSRFGRRRIRIEVRRARGRAASITPRAGEIAFLDDGVSGALGRKRSWWMESGAWAVFVDAPPDGSARGDDPATVSTHRP